ncbi:hypothetical protein CANINC_000106, partial [Pichia inconspicua]
SVDQLFGLLYLKSFNNTSAESRILDSANPQLELSAIEAALRDLATVSSTSQALISTNTKFNTKTKSSKNKKGLICRRCQAKGHTSPNCTAPTPVQVNKNHVEDTSNESTNLSWCADSLVENDSNMYTLDSGSTLHVCKNFEHLFEYSPLSAAGKISGISSSTLNILGYGKIIFDNNGSTITVSNVAFVPQARRNLLSINSISKTSGSKFIFDNNACYLDTGVLIGKFMTNTLYQFLPIPRVSNHISLSTALEIHSKLGHPNPTTMRAMGFTPPADVKLCTHCCAGKMTRAFPKFSTTKTTSPLQLLHVDICGIIPIPGVSGERYFLTIVDDFTRWCSIIPLATKAQTATALKEFVTQVETHFSSSGFKVAAVRSDNGKEFCNNNISDYFKNKGIVHQLTVPHNSSQNGVAERKHRTIQEKARTLLHESGLSYKFWSEAVKTAEFLVNRYPTPVLNGTSPFSLWHKRAPDYSIMHTFGCHCMVLVPPEKRSNIFSPVSIAAIFVGYSPTHKAYRVFVPQFDDIFISNNVRFDDSQFPMLNPMNHSIQSGSLASVSSSDIFFGRPAGGIPASAAVITSPVLSDSYVPSDRSSTKPVSSDHSKTNPSDDSGSDDSGSDASKSDGGLIANNVSESNVFPIVNDPVSDDVSHSASSSNLPSEANSQHLENLDELKNFDDLEDFAAQNQIDTLPPTAKDELFYPVYDEIHHVPIESSLLPHPNDAYKSTSSVANSDLPRPLAPPSILPVQRSLSQLSNSSIEYPAAKRVQLDSPDHLSFLCNNAISLAFSTAISSDCPVSLPITYHDVLSHSDRSAWLVAINIELQAHKDNNTWTFVKLPAGRRAIGCRWVFTIKNSTTPPTYKARLVAQGFRQVYGLDYFETFSPVVRYESIRIVLALSAQFGLEIHQMDVSTAFLNGKLNEEIYMKVPDGVDAPINTVCKLNKSLYGLKQAPLCWNTAINQVLLSAGFKRSVNEFGIYTKVKYNHILVVALYVDDLLICSNNAADIQEVKDLLSSHYKMKDLGVASKFLGMHLKQSGATIGLYLSQYLEQFLIEFNMQDCNPVATPFASGTDLLPGKSISEAAASRFRSMVGKLLFAANTCRPDLSFAASTLSRYIKDPRENHVAAAKHVLRYIKGTLDHGIIYQKKDKFELVGYSDSDWAGDKFDRKSITGYVFILAGAAITWKSRKQPTVALSSTEAEYMALGDTVKELLWLIQLLNHIGMKFNSPPIIFEDNEGCKLLTDHPVHHQRTKHIDIKYHFIRHHLAAKHFRLLSARTDVMAADMFTKSLHRVKFKKFVDMIGMHNFIQV